MVCVGVSGPVIRRNKGWRITMAEGLWRHGGIAGEGSQLSERERAMHAVRGGIDSSSTGAVGLCYAIETAGLCTCTRNNENLTEASICFAKGEILAQ